MSLTPPLKSALLLCSLIAACAKAPPNQAPVAKDPPTAFDAAEARIPEPPPAPEKSAEDLVDIRELVPAIILDIRYATAKNFTGQAVYPVARCLLRRPVAEALARVEKSLRSSGLRLGIWDCYRPISIQAEFWKLVPDERYVARAEKRGGRWVKGSKHNRGAAVDLTLLSAEGKTLPVPTDYDDFSARAHRGAKGIDAEAVKNAELLEAAMVERGFEPLPTEWWHFDGPGWQSYDLLDQPLEPAN